MVRNRSCPAVSHCAWVEGRDEGKGRSARLPRRSKAGAPPPRARCRGAHDLQLDDLAVELHSPDFLGAVREGGKCAQRRLRSARERGPPGRGPSCRAAPRRTRRGGPRARGAPPRVPQRPCALRPPAGATHKVHADRADVALRVGVVLRRRRGAAGGERSVRGPRPAAARHMAHAGAARGARAQHGRGRRGAAGAAPRRPHGRPGRQAPAAGPPEGTGARAGASPRNAAGGTTSPRPSRRSAAAAGGARRGVRRALSTYTPRAAARPRGRAP
jgi:hypothetical protein